MSTGDIVWACIIAGVIIALTAFLVGYNFGELKGGKYVIHELMQKGSVTMVHTDGNAKVIWEVDVPDERLTKDER